MYYLPYNKNLKAFSRKLRNNSTLGEILLWKQLRAGKMRGFTFNRQKPLGNYIVDFYCKPLQLVIEVDGGYHFEKEQKILGEDFLFFFSFNKYYCLKSSLIKLPLLLDATGYVNSIQQMKATTEIRVAINFFEGHELIYFQNDNS